MTTAAASFVASPHLIVAPVLLPMATAALMTLLAERRRALKSSLNVLACVAGLAIAVVLLLIVDADGAATTVGAVGIYLPSNWPVPFGIVLAVDRLSALMLVLSALIGLTTALFAAARWDRAGVHFHALFQLQLMGLNGAFLTADLFNLFVFFEVLLAASYGLLLHGSGGARVPAGLHYVALNLLAASLFLIGAAVLYGVTGTLNMADIAQKLPRIPAGDRGLLLAGSAVLAFAFLAKAALWPLCFWLPRAYSAASPPVAALFALLTKVGVYALLRMWTLLYPAGADSAPLFGADALVWGGLATLGFGAVGVFASQQLARLAAYGVIASSGTLLAAIGFARDAVTGGALFYLLASTLAASALFLLVELIERARRADETPLPLRATEAELHPFVAPEREAPPGTNLDDDEEAMIGEVIPAAMAFLGLAFVFCALAQAGLPPLAGFVAKFAMLSALLNPAAPVTAAGWTFLALLVVSGLTATVAYARVGMRHFWSPQEQAPPRLRVIECVPVALLLAAAAALVVQAEPVLRYTRETASALHRPQAYVDAVMAARPRPNPGAAGAGAQTP